MITSFRAPGSAAGAPAIQVVAVDPVGAWSSSARSRSLGGRWARAILACLAVDGGCNCGKPGAGLTTADGQLSTLVELDFGSVPIGQRARLRLPVHNIGAAAVEVFGQKLGGDGSFSAPVALAPSLSAGGTANPVLQFAPRSLGTASATWIVNNDGRTNPVAVKLTGKGIALRVQAAPAAIDFGPVQVGALARQCAGLDPCSVQFTNGGPLAVQLSIDLSHTDPAFALIDGQGQPLALTQTLAGGATLRAAVTFQPALVHTYSSSLSWSVEGFATPVPLHGQGVTGQIRCSPNPIAFGGGAPLSPGQTAAQTVTCANVGLNAVSIDCVSLESRNGGVPNTACGSDAPSLGFAQLPPFPLTLQPVTAAAGSFSFTLNYTAASAAVLDALDVDFTPLGAPSGSTATDAISGGGQSRPCQLQIQPAALNFGVVAGSTTAVRSAALVDVGGATCHLASLALDPSSDPGYHLDPLQPLAFSVPAGGSADLRVDFAGPAATLPAQRLGWVTFSSDDPSAVGRIPLRATASGPSPYAVGWPKWHHDNANSGKSEVDTGGNTGTVAWSYPLDDLYQRFGGAVAYLNSPVIGAAADGAGYTIYQVSGDGTLFAFSASGSVLWTYPLSDPSGDTHPSTPIVLADGSIFVCSGSETEGLAYYHLSAGGQLIDQGPYGVEGFSAAPSLDLQGDLFEADDDGIPPPGDGSDPWDVMAFKLDAAGRIGRSAGLRYPFAPTAQPGTLERFGLVVNDDGSSFWCVEGNCIGVGAPAAGFALLPNWPPAGVQIGDPREFPVSSDLALDRLTTGNLYVAAGWLDNDNAIGGRLTALDPLSGSSRWSLALPAGAGPGALVPPGGSAFGNGAPAVDDDGTVYVGSGAGLVSVDGPSGVQNWLAPCAGVVDAPAIGGDHTVFFGCGDGTFYAVDPRGQQKWAVSGAANIPVSGSPAIAPDGTIVFISDDGILRAVR